MKSPHKSNPFTIELTHDEAKKLCDLLASCITECKGKPNFSLKFELSLATNTPMITCEWLEE